MNARGLGSLIGAVGGLVFVLVNAGGLDGATVLRILAVALFLVTLVAAWRVPDNGKQPSSAAIRVYWWCVIGEVLAIPVGAVVLRALGEPDLTRVWVVLVLGVHFVPFARAFGEPVFGGLGALLIVLALVGGGLFLAGVDDAELWTAVAAGFVLFAFSIGGAVASRRSRAGALRAPGA